MMKTFGTRFVCFLKRECWVLGAGKERVRQAFLGSKDGKKAGRVIDVDGGNSGEVFVYGELV